MDFKTFSIDCGKNIEQKHKIEIWVIQRTHRGIDYYFALCYILRVGNQRAGRLTLFYRRG